jgi:hypothetical protein
MPNWVYNSLAIEAIEADPSQITKLVSQVNQPFQRQHDQWNSDTHQMELLDVEYSNPVFAFWNIVKPTDLETYALQKDPNHDDSIIDFQGNNWYDWNVRNWGTKWDVAVHDKEQYPETTMEHGDKSVIYSFNTAWSPPIPAVLALSEQYPDLVFHLFYQEETGWGGDMQIMGGATIREQHYESQCRDCDATDCMEYCDNDCGEICNECNYLGEADLDAVSECEIHKAYLDEEHVPEYRRLDKANA